MVVRVPYKANVETDGEEVIDYGKLNKGYHKLWKNRRKLRAIMHQKLKHRKPKLCIMYGFNTCH